MKFIEINPFVRYCVRTKLKKEFNISEKYISYDKMMLYFFSGSGEMSIGSESFSLKKGSLVIISSQIAFSFDNFDEDSEICLVHFDYTQLYGASHTFRIPLACADDFCADDVLYEESFEKERSFNSYIALSEMNYMQDSFLDMSRVFKKRGKYYEIILKGRMLLLLAGACQALSEENFAFVKNDLSDRIVEFIDENYSKSLSNKQIGEVFNFNPLYISKLVKNKTGYPLHEYIIIRRISRAVELLENSDMSITETGYISGFADMPHFSRSFKKYMGVSPEEYRKRVQSKLSRGQ